MAFAEYLRRTAVKRELSSYPSPPARVRYLVLTVLAAIISNYHTFLGPAVLPLLQRDLGISLQLFGLASMVALVLGAVGSLVGGLSDRLGRANLVVYGTTISALLTLGLVAAPNAWSFLIGSWLIVAVEGATLVATLALVRDFSPRLSRAVAIGFWSIGPWGGQILANLVASTTLPLFDTWQSQYAIAGLLSLLAAALCFVGMRELSPELRRQIIVGTEGQIASDDQPITVQSISKTDSAVISVLRPALLVSALGYGLFQVVRFTTGSYLPTYLNSVLLVSLAQANEIASFFGLGFIVGELFAGFVSDRIQLRKPIVLVGVICVLVMLLLFMQIRVGTGTLHISVTLLGLSLAMASVNVTWLASYIETAEAIDTSRVATALARLQALTRSVLVVAILAFVAVVGDGQGWARWWWICVVCVVFFLPTIAALHGPWRRTRPEAVLIPDQSES